MDWPSPCFVSLSRSWSGRWWSVGISFPARSSARVQALAAPRWALALSRARRVPRGPGRSALLPAVVRESLVGLCHLVQVLLALDRGADAVGGIQDLVGEPECHRAFPAGARVADKPADRQCRRAARPELDGDLICGTTYAAAADLELGTGVVECPLQQLKRVAAGLLAHNLEGVVHDALGQRALSPGEHLVAQLGH